MWYLLSVAAGMIAGVAAILLLEARYRKRRRRKDKKPAKKARKFEFSKLILMAVLATYFVGFAVGIKIVFIDVTQLGVLLAYIGTPTATAIGFYAWKAKAENVVKIKQANPEATEGMPVDLNNITTP
jgi:Na+/H+ antiporter NhaD/arsenite permease-like protein